MKIHGSFLGPPLVTEEWHHGRGRIALRRFHPGLCAAPNPQAKAHPHALRPAEESLGSSWHILTYLDKTQRIPQPSTSKQKLPTSPKEWKIGTPCHSTVWQLRNHWLTDPGISGQQICRAILLGFTVYSLQQKFKLIEDDQTWCQLCETTYNASWWFWFPSSVGQLFSVVGPSSWSPGCSKVHRHLMAAQRDDYTSIYCRMSITMHSWMINYSLVV